MPIGYWIRLWWLALNPFATVERVQKLLLQYRVPANPEASRPDSYYDAQEVEKLAASGVVWIGGDRGRSLRTDIVAGRVFRYKGVRIQNLIFYPGVSTCAVVGTTYRVEAAVLLGFRAIYGEPTEAYPFLSSGIGNCI